jgi:hypothetical protein
LILKGKGRAMTLLAWIISAISLYFILSNVAKILDNHTAERDANLRQAVRDETRR